MNNKSGQIRSPGKPLIVAALLAAAFLAIVAPMQARAQLHSDQTIAVGDTLTKNIPWTIYRTVTNNGTVVTNSTTNLSKTLLGDDPNIDNQGLWTANGDTTLTSGSKAALSNSGTFNNGLNGSTPTLTLEASTVLTNQKNAIFNNRGDLFANSNSQLDNAGQLINRSGAILTLEGTLNNKTSGQLDNFGTLTSVNGRINNFGKLNNKAGATLNNHTGVLDNKVGGTLTNAGMLSNSRHTTLDNSGTLNNNLGATLENSGTLNNLHELNNCVFRVNVTGDFAKA